MSAPHIGASGHVLAVRMARHGTVWPQFAQRRRTAPLSAACSLTSLLSAASPLRSKSPQPHVRYCSPQPPLVRWHWPTMIHTRLRLPRGARHTSVCYRQCFEHQCRRVLRSKSAFDTLLMSTSSAVQGKEQTYRIHVSAPLWPTDCGLTALYACAAVDSSALWPVECRVEACGDAPMGSAAIGRSTL